MLRSELYRKIWTVTAVVVLFAACFWLMLVSVIVHSTAGFWIGFVLTIAVLAIIICGKED